VTQWLTENIGKISKQKHTERNLVSSLYGSKNPRKRGNERRKEKDGGHRVQMSLSTS